MKEECKRKNVAMSFAIDFHKFGFAGGNSKAEQVVQTAETFAAFLRPTEDPLLGGTSSPALERYRQARAELAEAELEAKRGLDDQEIEPSCTVSKVSDLECRSVFARVGEKLRSARVFMRTLGDADAMGIGRLALRDVLGELNQLHSQLEESADPSGA